MNETQNTELYTQRAKNFWYEGRWPPAWCRLYLRLSGKEWSKILSVSDSNHDRPHNDFFNYYQIQFTCLNERQLIIADFPQTILNHCPTAKVLCSTIVQRDQHIREISFHSSTRNKILISWSRGINEASVCLQVICQLRRAENIMFLSAELGRDFQIMVMMRPSLTEPAMMVPVSLSPEDQSWHPRSRRLPHHSRRGLSFSARC